MLEVMFCFFKQKTAYEMRMSDWSSDVCSSDLPGVLIMASIMLTNVVINRLHGYENSSAAFSFRRWLRAVWAGKFALMVPVVILGGIYSGIFTPTEAAAVAVVTIIVIGLFQGRSEEHTSELPSLMRISYAVFCLKTKKQIKIT